MDLGAYIQINDLDTLAKANGISVPRLRGYRLMCEEPRLSQEDIAEAIRSYELYLCEYGCRSVPRFRPGSNTTEISRKTRKIEKKYLLRETKTGVRADGSSYSWTKTTGFRWDLLHGKNRKEVKFAIKKGRKDVVKQLETFNKYVGREDVLYIHARIGGRNWLFYGGEDIAQQPWFLEKVDDYFDCTYCDIYALVDRGECDDAKESNTRTE